MSSWSEIDDAWVYKPTATFSILSNATIGVGDIIKRYPTTQRFIVARVDALPYTDDANLTFFKDINIL